MALPRLEMLWKMPKMVGELLYWITVTWPALSQIQRPPWLLQAKCLLPIILEWVEILLGRGILTTSYRVCYGSKTFMNLMAPWHHGTMVHHGTMAPWQLPEHWLVTSAHLLNASKKQQPDGGPPIPCATGRKDLSHTWMTWKKTGIWIPAQILLLFWSHLLCVPRSYWRGGLYHSQLDPIHDLQDKERPPWWCINTPRI